MISTRYSYRLLVGLAAAACFRCGESPTEPLVRTAVPSPTATPAPQALRLAGPWAGTMEFNPSDQPDCPVRESVRLDLSHSDRGVFGTVGTTCWGTLWLYGSLDGDREGAVLTVDVWTSGEEKVTTLTGRAYSTRIDVSRRSLINRGFPIALELTR